MTPESVQERRKSVTRVARSEAAAPRLLIEEWLPAAAIGVECMRERSTGQQPPDKRFHVWWARRPLAVSRAAVLASILPAHFPREVFERLLGFWGPSRDVVVAQAKLELARQKASVRIRNPHGERAFKSILLLDDLSLAHHEIERVWGKNVGVLDPMAGGGSIPLEASRLGLKTIAGEYSPVACSVLEATIDYPFRFGENLAGRARRWASVWRERFNKRLSHLYPGHGAIPPHCYIFARTVPCPDTQFDTPLVPDWHLLNPKGAKVQTVAEPIVDRKAGRWRVRIREAGSYAGQLREAPKPTYSKGKGISLFTGRPIPADYIKAQAQAGQMRSVLYAVAVKKTPGGLEFQEPVAADFRALEEAEAELARLRPQWEKANVLPTEEYPAIASDPRPRLYGMPRWADMFTPRQLLCAGVLVEVLLALREEILRAEGRETGEAVVHLLALVLDKFLNYNCVLASWHAPRQVIRSLFDRHDFSFKPTFAEMAPCNAGAGLAWAIDNVLEAYGDIAKLPRAEEAAPAEIFQGSSTNLPQIADGSITAVVVDPPYDDNVQYSELADFFYVWLKRTQGRRRPEWFATHLCPHDEEAVVNLARHRGDGESAQSAREKARGFYRKLMTGTFRECRRVLRDDGVLTVMFTHKKQAAWEALFEALIEAEFRVTATWPVKTESEHSLHQAKKNAAQSTVILAARKRPADAVVGYFDTRMGDEIRQAARRTAERLKGEGLNAVDQLVGSFGPAMEVFSRYEKVRTDTGEPIGVERAIDLASQAVSEWRIEQLAGRGLEGVEAEGRFYLLCWDVLGAAEFRFNEANLLGKAVGIDVDQLILAGLVEKTGDKVRVLPARKRRRERALKPQEYEETFFGSMPVKKKRVTKKDALRVHPNDPDFRTALDGCHALALAYLEAGGGSGGIGAAKGLANRQAWKPNSPVARLMEALLKAAPEGVRHPEDKQSAARDFPEFAAWHAMLQPLFVMAPPDWTKRAPAQGDMLDDLPEEEDLVDEESEDEDGGEETEDDA